MLSGETIREIEENIRNDEMSKKQYRYMFRGKEILMTVLGKIILFNNVPDSNISVNNTNHNQLISPSQSILEYANIVIIINESGSTYIAKNRYGNIGIVNKSKSNNIKINHRSIRNSIYATTVIVLFSAIFIKISSGVINNIGYSICTVMLFIFFIYMFEMEDKNNG